MEIYLKMTPKSQIEQDKTLTIKHFEVSQACGYSFHSVQSITTNSQVESMPIQQAPDNQLQDILSQMTQAYNGHRIDEAFKHSQSYLKILEQKKTDIDPQYQRMIEAIKQEIQDVWQYERELSPDGWVHKKDGSFYKIFTKHFDDTVAVLVDAELQIPIEKFIFVLNEFDLMKDFMPFMQHSREVKEISRNCKIGHIVNNFPILSKREAFFQGIGYDRMQHDRTILLYSRSLHNRVDLQQKLGYKVVPNEDSVQLQYKFFLVQYKPIDRTKGKIKIAMNVDMKISAPKFILDPVTQNFGKDFLKNVLEVTQKFQGSEWHKRSIQKTEFTNFIRSTIDQYFPQ